MPDVSPEDEERVEQVAKALFDLYHITWKAKHLEQRPSSNPQFGTWERIKEDPVQAPIIAGWLKLAELFLAR